jgi:hypothetical protein
MAEEAEAFTVVVAADSMAVVVATEAAADTAKLI